MLLEKKMFGHWPFCCSASISVPGAPASSLVTESQPAAANPGVEICCPVCVAVALLSTFHPPAPRSETALDPVGGAAARRGPAGSPRATAWPVPARYARVPEPAARTAAEAKTKPIQPDFPMAARPHAGGA